MRGTYNDDIEEYGGFRACPFGGTMARMRLNKKGLSPHSPPCLPPRYLPLVIIGKRLIDPFFQKPDLLARRLLNLMVASTKQ